MRNISSFIKRHSVVTFFVLAYSIPWSAIFVVASLRGFRAERFQPSDIMIMLAAMLLGPSLASIILTSIVEGKNGLRSLFVRMFHWQVPVRWYAVMFLFPALIMSILMILMVLVSPIFAPSFTVIGLVIGLVVGFFEEIGWTGFALPKLQSKYSPLISGLMLGLLWGFWHIVADYFGNFSSLGELWLPYFIFGFVAAMTATRILIAWVYNNTGSVFLAQLMHASSTGFLCALGISATSDFGPEGYALSFVVYALAIWVVVAVILARYGKRLVRQTIQMQVDHRESRLASPG